MKRILYILKQNDPAVHYIIERQAKEAHVEVVLIQDALSIVLDVLDGNVFDLSETHEKKDYPSLSYQELIEKIFRADTVITW